MNTQHGKNDDISWPALDVVLEKMQEQLPVLELAGVGSWEWDIKRDSVSWSAKMCRLFGVAKSPRTFEDFLAEIHPEDQEAFQEGTRNALRTGTLLNVHHRIIRPGGEVRVLRTCAQGAAGSRMQGISQDVTEFDRLEKELAMLRSEMSELIIERTRDIADINTSLVRSLHEKDLMLSEMNHRMKNNIQMLSSLIKLQFRQETDTNAAVSAIQDRLKAFRQVHETLYDSRNLSHIDFKKYATGLLGRIARASIARKSDVSFERDISSVHLDADRATKLGLVLNELVSNALKHGEKPGVISVSFRQKESYILKVANTGKPRRPLDITMPSSTGLTLVLSLVEQMGGTITVQESEKTEFTVTIPVKKRWNTPEY